MMNVVTILVNAVAIAVCDDAIVVNGDIIVVSGASIEEGDLYINVGLDCEYLVKTIGWKQVLQKENAAGFYTVWEMNEWDELCCFYAQKILIVRGLISII